MVTLVFLFAALLVVVTFLPKYLKFSGSGYERASGNGFFKTISDTGIYGEFLTFLYLEGLKGHHRLMTNLYLPKSDGTTTEVDLIMLSPSGIYVFESKNYSGWIFGAEKSRNWTQMLGNKQKNRFLNPIWQNKGHIDALKTATGLDNNRFYKSYIVFSERCMLKKVQIDSPDIKVIKRDSLIQTIKIDIQGPSLLTIEEVDYLYLKLGKYTHADEAVKKAHIEHIQMKRS